MSWEQTELAYAGAAAQAEMVRERSVHPRELIEASLARIAALDPLLNAFRVVRAEKALAEAESIGAGPLAGVPVAIKDDTDVAGERTCYGTAVIGAPAPADAPVVARLRSAGAIVIGKTNVPELDSWGFTESMTFGITRNPWDPQRTPGGSSGGSGVAVATGMCGVGHGTDGTGSLRNPPAWLGVIGFKPSRGLIPGPAALSGWHGMVVNGPIGRRARDVGAFLEATAGPGFLQAASQSPQPLRIAVSLKPPPAMGGKLDEARRQAVEEAVELLRSLGHQLDECEPSLPKLTSLAIDARYFGGIAEDLKMLGSPQRVETRTRSVAKIGGLLRPALKLAPQIERAAAAALDEIFANHDLMVFPGSVQGPEPVGYYESSGALSTGYRDTARVAFQPLWNLVGRPAMMIPWGFDRDALPTAVQFGAPPGQERLLLSLAAQLEESRGWPDHRPPVD